MLPMKDKVPEAEAGQMVAYIRAFRGRKQVVALEPQKHPIPPGPAHPAIVPGPKVSTPSSGLTTPSAEVAGRLREATGLYRQYCVTCHGPGGGGTAMRASMPAIPNFTDRAWQASHSDPQLLVSIRNGNGFMPAFSGRVSNEQARDLVAYIRAFGPPETNVTEPPASDFEKRFQHLQHQWDKLDKQLRKLSPQTQHGDGAALRQILLKGMVNSRALPSGLKACFCTPVWNPPSESKTRRSRDLQMQTTGGDGKVEVNVVNVLFVGATMFKIQLLIATKADVPQQA